MGPENIYKRFFLSGKYTIRIAKNVCFSECKFTEFADHSQTKNNQISLVYNLFVNDPMQLAHPETPEFGCAHKYYTLLVSFDSFSAGLTASFAASVSSLTGSSTLAVSSLNSLR